MDTVTTLLPDIFQTAVGSVILVVVIVWSAVWKILALYRSASRKHKVWFVVLFFVNTAGILEIIYLLVHLRRPKRA
jgi:hypothetical protein